jgi:outer membrane protein OmpA-like peptidoglycan-associated protein
MKPILTFLISGAMVVAAACRPATTGTVTRVDQPVKEYKAPKHKPVKSGHSVSSGEPQKNTAVAVILDSDVGGDEGIYISKQMDAQAMDIGKEKLTGGSILRVGEGIKITYDGSAMFAKNTYILTEASQKDLRRIAATLKEYNNTRLVIEGHTDGEGTEKDNMTLSHARAKAVADFFLKEKIPANKIQVIGYGEEQPLFSNETAEGRRQNRRIEIVVIADETLRDQAKKN